MRSALIFWGDPYSAYALQNALEGSIEVRYLVSVLSKIPGSLSTYPNIKLLRLISEATDIPLIYKTSDASVWPLIEESLKPLKREIDIVVIGIAPSQETDSDARRGRDPKPNHDRLPL